MTTTAKNPARSPSPSAVQEPNAGPWYTPPWTTAERLQRIEALGPQSTRYIQYICQVDSLDGTSAEAKEKAVIAFYDRLLVLERQLGRIQEELQLG